MRWPWSKAPQQQLEPTSDDAHEAAAARRRAEEELRLAKEQTSEVCEVAEQLRKHRRQNHFADLFGRTLGGR